MENKDEEYVKLRKKIDKILIVIKDVKQKHKAALEKIEKGAIKDGKTLDDGKIAEQIEKESKMIKKLSGILAEIES